MINEKCDSIISLYTRGKLRMGDLFVHERYENEACLFLSITEPDEHNNQWCASLTEHGLELFARWNKVRIVQRFWDAV